MSDQIKETTVFGVKGKIIGPRIGAAKRGANRERITKQTFTSEMRAIKGFGPGGQMQVTIRWDDGCGNGHSLFAITAIVWTKASRASGDIDVGGCLHDDIAKVFPEFKPIIKWHLMGEVGPTHYIANTVYFAGDRDHTGRRKGEPSRFETWLYEDRSAMGHRLSEGTLEILKKYQEDASRGEPSVYLEVVEVPFDGVSTVKYKSKYTLSKYPAPWAWCAFDSEREAQEFAVVLRSYRYRTEEVPVAWSEGKERDLAAARRAAIWPDATDEQLCLPKEELTKLLEARLPALLAEFKQVIADIGFVWSL